MDAALLRLESDATDHGAEVASIFEGELSVGVRTTTVGIGVAFEGAVLEYYDSEVAEVGRCIMGRADFDPVHDFCVGISGSTQRTGYGDSGGPLYVPAPGLHGGFRLAGVVKGGGKAGLTGPEETEFIRYANVALLRRWIRTVVDTAE